MSTQSKGSTEAALSRLLRSDSVYFARRTHIHMEHAHDGCAVDALCRVCVSSCILRWRSSLCRVCYASVGEKKTVFTAAVWCVPALRVPLVHSLINHFRQRYILVRSHVPFLTTGGDRCAAPAGQRARDQHNTLKDRIGNKLCACC